jgi:hypothetical protein
MSEKPATSLPWLEIDAQSDGPSADLTRREMEAMGFVLAERIPFGTNAQRRALVIDLKENDPRFNNGGQRRATNIDLRDLNANGLLDEANGVPGHEFQKRVRKRR